MCATLHSSASPSPSLLQQPWLHQTIALIVRLALIAFGEYHDRHSSLPYTDVDYHVLRDGARHILLGESPFRRHTYRYTPLLAWFMLPSVVGPPVLGKLLFCALDGIAAELTRRTLLLRGHSMRQAATAALMWLGNPVTIAISTRGSAESVVVTLVLLTLYCYQRDRVVLTGVMLGVAVHVKLYPIIYSLPLYLSLEPHCGKNAWQWFYPTLSRLKLSLSAIASFVLLTGTGYWLYGFEYIQEGFLYHVSRVDTRHNFSIYFYLLYLTTDYDVTFLGIATFAPQFLLVAAYGVAYGTKQHLTLALFCQTVVMVTYNKVITSQYFLWYLALLPLLCYHLDASRRKCALLLLLWLLAQAAWLLPAYLLEFSGMNVFLPIWLESIAFFCCNVGVLMSVISSYWAKEELEHKQKQI